jgi:hypothetical protein
MEKARLMTLARQGDARAIALLLQRALGSTAIGIRAQCADGRLHLIFDVPPEADVPGLDQIVQTGMLRLKVPTIHTVQIDAYEANSQNLIWSNTLTFAVEQSAYRPAPVSLTGSLVGETERETEYVIPASYPGSSDVPEQMPAPRGVSANGPMQRQPRRPSPQPANRKAPPQDWGFWLLHRFNWFKLALVVFLASHSIFGSPHYTIIGFLTGADPLMGFLHNVNLIFHEAGHVLFMPFGRFLHILGGSLLQILIPAGLCGYFWFTRQPYASAIALWWTGQNFLDVSIYIRDAQERLLPLLGGEAVLHDWHFLLLDLRLLPQANAVANLAFATGILLYLIAIPWGFYTAQVSETNDE